MRHAFTLIELLVVITIVALLAAILFPVFGRTRRSAQQTACLSNLRQIGTATLLYAADYDDLLLWGGDPDDLHSGGWSGSADEAKVLSMKPQHELLQPYIKSHALFHCPADTGFPHTGPVLGSVLPTAPSSFQKWGSSYYSRTALILLLRPLSGLSAWEGARQIGGTESVLFFMDGGGHWHGGGTEEDSTVHRLNGWFLDGHVKNLSIDAILSYSDYDIK